MDSSPVVSPLILDAKLEAYVEAIDLVNGEYGSCWDAKGAVQRCAAPDGVG
jgi:hypothetical protein